MSSATETAVSRSHQTASVAKESVSGLPREFQSPNDPEISQVLQIVGGKIRELETSERYVLSPDDYLRGLQRFKPQTSWQGLPIFNNQPHPLVDGIEWGMGIVMQSEGLRSLFSRSAVVLLTPHAGKGIDPRVYFTRKTDPRMVMEILTEFGLGIDQRIVQIAPQHATGKIKSFS